MGVAAVDALRHDVSALVGPSALRAYLLHGLDAAGGPCSSATFAQLLDAALTWVEKTPQLAGTLALPITLEMSAVCDARGVNGARYIVGLPCAALGREPWPLLEQWLSLVQAPRQVAEVLGQLRLQGEVPTALQLGVAYSATSPAPSLRCYVERRPLQALLDLADGTPTLAMLAAVWPQGSAEVSWRRYDEAPMSSSNQVSDRLALILAELIAITEVRYIWSRRDMGASAVARDTYLHLPPTPKAVLAEVLAELIHAVLGQATARQQWHNWHDSVPATAQIRTIGWGTSSSGEPRCKIYHGPPAPSEPHRIPGQGHLRAGAAELEVATPDGAVGWILVSPAFHTGARPIARTASGYVLRAHGQADVAHALDAIAAHLQRGGGIGAGDLSQVVHACGFARVLCREGADNHSDQ